MSEPVPYTDDTVEIVAAAIAAARDDDVFTDSEWNGSHWEGNRDQYRSDARAALNVLAAAGLLLPPDEPRRCHDVGLRLGFGGPLVAGADGDGLISAVGLGVGVGVLVRFARRGSSRGRVGRGCGKVLGGITVRSTTGGRPSCPDPAGAGVTADAGGVVSTCASA